MPAWWRLWEQSGATPFQSPAWLLPWWDAFYPGELHVLAVRDGADLRALAPFYIDSACVVRPIGVSLSDYFDVLIAPAFLHDAGGLLGDAIASDLRDGTVQRWEMPDLAPDATAWHLAPAALATTADDAPCPVLGCTEAGDLLLAVPAGKRRKLRMAHHRAARAGRGGIGRVTGDAIPAAFEALVRLHRARWREEGGGVLNDPRALSFHRAAMPALDRAGLLDLLVCEAGTAVIGVYYGLRDRTRAYAYLGGYDTAHAALSPGSRLLGEAIEDAGRHGARTFHFLRGAEPYKYEWGAVDAINRQRVFHPLAATPDV